PLRRPLPERLDHRPLRDRPREPAPGGPRPRLLTRPAMSARTYAADGIEVRYDPRRCIHFEACVRGLPRVFDPNRRPWIDPAQAAPAAGAEVVTRCPPGALHFTRTDGGPGEAVPTANAVTVAPDGPLYVRGDVRV